MEKKTMAFVPGDVQGAEIHCNEAPGDDGALRVGGLDGRCHDYLLVFRAKACNHFIVDGEHQRIDDVAPYGDIFMELPDF
jgi:hypothetical protein